MTTQEMQAIFDEENFIDAIIILQHESEIKEEARAFLGTYHELWNKLIRLGIDYED